MLNQTLKMLKWSEDDNVLLISLIHTKLSTKMAIIKITNTLSKGRKIRCGLKVIYIIL